MKLDLSSSLGRGTLAVIVFIILILRIVYGVVSEFWFEDEFQIYLIGLKYYTTGTWPYYGPDVVYTQSQIPGALQGLLVGLPLYLFPIPEAPAIFLNILSFGVLCFFAWYLQKRFPALPNWVVWLWVLTCPWAIRYGTRVVNPTYILLFSVPFFIGFFELCKFFGNRIVSPFISIFLMGLALTSVMQLHLSWVLFLPCIAYAFFELLRTKELRISHILLLIAGAGTGALTLIPTFLQYGSQGSGGTENNIVFAPENILNIFTILVRFLSFATFEVGYMLGNDRAELLEELWWMIPVVGVAFVFGGLQLLLLAFISVKRSIAPGWEKFRWLTLSAFLIIFLSFFFSIKNPSSHTFFIAFPVAMVYSFFAYTWLEQRYPSWKRYFAIGLLAGVLFHTGLGIYQYRHASVYKDRDKVVRAIKAKDYTILGKRRADEWGHGY